MFEDNVNSLLTKAESEKHLVISFSLLMKLFEWCHDEAKDDVDMHKVMEKLVAFNDGVNPLTIDVYDCLMADIQPCEKDCQIVDNVDTGCDNACDSNAEVSLVKTCDNDCPSLNAMMNCNNKDNVFVDHGYREMDLDSILGTAKPAGYFGKQVFTISTDDNACNNPCPTVATNDGLDADVMNQINQVLAIAH